MGSGSSKSEKFEVITPELKNQLEQGFERLKKEAHNDKEKAEAVLSAIQSARLEMLKENIEIGESSLSKLRRAEKEKAELLNRLSSLASDRMRNNNAKIADLSDTNRPTKLTERFSELYDNEWTDVFVKLKAQYNKDAKDTDKHVAERTAIETLLLILKICYTKCKEIAVDQRQKLLDMFVISSQRKDPSSELRINECQKQIAEITIKDLQQGCKGLIEKSIERKEDKERAMEYMKMEPDLIYGQSCIGLTWLMCIQAPPVILEFEQTKGIIAEYFRTYTRSGDKPDFVVWPVLFLYQDGPVLSKGVIQFKDNKKSDKKSSKINSKHPDTEKPGVEQVNPIENGHHDRSEGEPKTIDKVNFASSEEQEKQQVPHKTSTPGTKPDRTGPTGSKNKEKEATKTNSSVNESQETKVKRKSLDF